MRTIKPWTIREAEYLRKNYPTTKIEDLVKTLGRPAGSIREYACRNLKVGKKIYSNGWTPEEDKIIMDHLNLERAKLANYLPDRSLQAIAERKRFLKRRVTTLIESVV